MKISMLIAPFSLFNELSTEKKNYGCSSRFNPHIFISFFDDLAKERKTMLKAPGSIPRFLFHFLMNLLQRGKLCS
jgi:hypothetical protein